MANNRLERCFAKLKTANRPALITFLTAGDPRPDVSYQLLKNMPNAGADIIELGMPFSDPMADGPSIQLANQRALAGGMTLKKTLAQVQQFRQLDDETPIILMGYFNPIHHYGVEAFVSRALEIGVDGLIIVDLPGEEDDELCHQARTAGIDWVRLIAPTTQDARLKQLLDYASGFVYYVSIAGITGTASAKLKDVEKALKNIQTHSDLPIAVGFGIKTPEQVKAMGKIADGVVVGSAIVDVIAQAHEQSLSNDETVAAVTGFVSELAKGCCPRNA